MVGLKRRMLVGLFVGLSVLAGLAAKQVVPVHQGVTVAPAGQHIAVGDNGPIWPPRAYGMTR